MSDIVNHVPAFTYRKDEHGKWIRTDTLETVVLSQYRKEELEGLPSITVALRVEQDGKVIVPDEGEDNG